MNMSRPVTEDDLQSYVDNALDTTRRTEVEAWLADNPEAARRVDGFIAQRALLRGVLGPIAEEEVPERFQADALLARVRVPSSRRPLWQAAAAVLLLLAGGAAGWFGHDMTERQGTGASIAQEALASFDVYGSDAVRPVEISATNREDLLKWLSKRLGQPISAPDLSASGYRFLGGRLVATQHGPAGLFIYDNGAGDRIAMLVRPMGGPRDMPMTEHQDGRMAGYVWAQNGMGYSVVGAAPPDVLHPLANEARRQIRAAT
jgi:anti-sigma factor RsiW